MSNFIDQFEKWIEKMTLQELYRARQFFDEQFKKKQMSAPEVFRDTLLRQIVDIEIKERETLSKGEKKE